MNVRLTLLTAAALVGFAANSLLTRGAIAAGRIDPASFLALRIAGGAAALWLIAHRRPASQHDAADSWLSALALSGYGVCFTFAYTRVGAGVGALALFGAVQTTMIGAGVWAGERPGLTNLGGLALAAAGLLTLTLRGASAPSLAGLALMVAAGVCWGIYSLRGRRSRDPLLSTAHNFLRAAPVALGVLAIQAASIRVTAGGVWLALTSGALTSGVAYAFWFAALPSLTAWRAAVVQLMTPILTAIAAVAILGERTPPQLYAAGSLIIAGVLLSLRPGRRATA